MSNRFQLAPKGTIEYDIFQKNMDLANSFIGAEKGFEELLIKERNALHNFKSVLIPLINNKRACEFLVV